FGSNMGDRSVIRSLATLAHQGRRSEFAQTQLLAALEILQRGDTTAADMTGSWAGAMGQTQFIPTTYNEHAVDFDGNGKRDIWHTEADALASAANYLRASNWQSGAPWGQEVRLPASFDYTLADMSIRKTLAEWSALGVQDARGRAVPPVASRGACRPVSLTRGRTCGSARAWANGARGACRMPGAAGSATISRVRPG